MIIPKSVIKIAKMCAAESTRYALAAVHVFREKGGQCVAEVTDGRAYVRATWNDKALADQTPLSRIHVDNKPKPKFDALLTAETWAVGMPKDLKIRAVSDVVLDENAGAECDGLPVHKMGLTTSPTADSVWMAHPAETGVKFPKVDDSNVRAKYRVGHEAVVCRVDAHLLGSLLTTMAKVAHCEDGFGKCSVDITVPIDRHQPLRLAAGHSLPGHDVDAAACVEGTLMQLSSSAEVEAADTDTPLHNLRAMRGIIDRLLRLKTRQGDDGDQWTTEEFGALESDAAELWAKIYPNSAPLTGATPVAGYTTDERVEQAVPAAAGSPTPEWVAHRSIVAGIEAGRDVVLRTRTQTTPLTSADHVQYDSGRLQVRVGRRWVNVTKPQRESLVKQAKATAEASDTRRATKKRATTRTSKKRATKPSLRLVSDLETDPAGGGGVLVTVTRLRRDAAAVAPNGGAVCVSCGCNAHRACYQNAGKWRIVDGSGTCPTCQAGDVQPPPPA